MWIGGQAAGAIKRAARLGDAWYTPPFPTHGELKGLRQLFLDTRAEAGLPLDGDFPVRRELLIAPSKAAGTEAALERYRARYETYKKWGLSGENTPVDDGAELRADIENRFILGSAAECVDELGALGEEIGMTHFIYKPHWPGLAHADAMAQLEEFGTKVLPELALDEARGRPGRRRHRRRQRHRPRDGRRVRGPGADRRPRRRRDRRRWTPRSAS